ncbi:MAG TPA: ABC transporter substrate-binding protein [Pseudonocardiaceae bacterium]
MTPVAPFDRRQFLRFGALAGAGAFTLAACGTSRSSGSSGAVLTVTDQRGQAIHLSGPATRVVTIPIPTASMVMAIAGSAAPLVGINSSSEAAIRSGILGDIFPEAKKLPDNVADSSFAPNVESILALKPDVVIQWASYGAGIITPLQEAGLNVVGLTYGTQADLVTWISLFGEILGRQARAMRINENMSTALTEVKRQVPSGASRPKLLYFQSVLKSMTVAGTETYEDYYFDLVGGENAAGAVKGAPTVDVEQVIAWDPDIILVGNFDAATPETITSNKALAKVSAVRENRVYKVPLGGYRWDPPSQESPLMWRWLLGLAHPDTDSSGLRAQIVADYQLLYGYTPTEAQIDRILQMDLNGSAAGYARFKG